MKRPERVADYLDHIIEAIDDATTYILDADDVAAFGEDRKTQAAVIRSIEIIGEAANRIHKQAPEFVSAHPELPWIEMRGMRNKIIHDYFDVDLSVVLAHRQRRSAGVAGAYPCVVDGSPARHQRVGGVEQDALARAETSNRTRAKRAIRRHSSRTARVDRTLTNADRSCRSCARQPGPGRYCLQRKAANSSQSPDDISPTLDRIDRSSTCTAYTRSLSP